MLVVIAIMSKRVVHGPNGMHLRAKPPDEAKTTRHRANLDGEESCRCVQLGTEQNRGAAAGATEYYYPAPTRVRLPC